jgi:hypothetical protein
MNISWFATYLECQSDEASFLQLHSSHMAFAVVSWRSFGREVVRWMRVLGVE